jgi:hypothetical protein
MPFHDVYDPLVVRNTTTTTSGSDWIFARAEQDTEIRTLLPVSVRELHIVRISD